MTATRTWLLTGLLAGVSLLAVACDAPQDTSETRDTAPTTEAAAPETPAVEATAPDASEAVSTETASVEDATTGDETQETVDERYIWDLTDLYATPEDWSIERDTVRAQFVELRALEGTLGESAQSLLVASDRISQLYKDAIRLLVYATLKADEDTRIAENQERRQLSQALLSEFGQAVSWYSPEVLAIGEEQIRAFLAEEPELERHRAGLENTLRQAPHTLSPEGEQLMAASGILTSAPNTIYGILANSDLPWEEITLSNGETVTLNQSAYTLVRQAQSRDDRRLVFETFWGTWKDYENSMGTVLNSHLQGLKFQTEARNHEGSLGRALFGDNMPEAVYRTLVSEVNEALPTLHRYFELRKRMLGIEDELRYYDIYPALVDLDKEYSIETSIELTREAIEPLGEEYVAAYDMSVEDRWMHVYPQPGKRSGAYMFGAAYDVHPYVLLNHNDNYESASTFAHELGHAVHSVLANAEQPWETASYATFVAETAAIMNEMLLQDLVVARAETPEERLYYLGAGLESLRGTYFRQTMFAEFELRVNELVGEGEVLTGARFSEIYLDLLKRYHGHDQGVMQIDDLYGIEWAYIPHFYYDFYVFQYSTSIAAAAYMAREIGEGNTEIRDAFITMLKAGGADYPYNLMLGTGLDMATPAPYEALIARMNATMDEMEAILDDMEGGAEETDAPAAEEPPAEEQ